MSAVGSSRLHLWSHARLNAPCVIRPFSARKLDRERQVAMNDAEVDTIGRMPAKTIGLYNVLCCMPPPEHLAFVLLSHRRTRWS